MTQNPLSGRAQPRIEDLMARFLTRQAEDRAAGIPEPPVGEVEPHEAAFTPAVEPRTALDEAVVALKLCAPDGGLASIAMPPDWANLVAADGGHFAVPLAAGGFPQLLRDLPALLRAEKRSTLLVEGSPVGVPSLVRWANDAAEKVRLPQALVGAGALRLARQFDAADAVLDQLRSNIPEKWRTALDNEIAALAWARGNVAEAERIWAAMPKSAVTCFNRGMAALFNDRNAEAKAFLKDAAALLPEDSAWQHLANLYLALAAA
jgi:hypothetical protein